MITNHKEARKITDRLELVCSKLCATNVSEKMQDTLLKEADELLFDAIQFHNICKTRLVTVDGKLV